MPEALQAVCPRSLNRNDRLMYELVCQRDQEWHANGRTPYTFDTQTEAQECVIPEMLPQVSGTEVLIAGRISDISLESIRKWWYSRGAEPFGA